MNRFFKLPSHASLILLSLCYVTECPFDHVGEINCIWKMLSHIVWTRVHDLRKIYRGIVIQISLSRSRSSPMKFNGLLALDFIVDKFFDGFGRLGGCYISLWRTQAHEPGMRCYSLFFSFHSGSVVGFFLELASVGNYVPPLWSDMHVWAEHFVPWVSMLT